MMTTEYAAFVGLAEAAGLPVERVAELARKDQLRSLFKHGRRYFVRDSSAPRTPQHAQLSLHQRRFSW